LCNLVENYNEINIVGTYYGNEKLADANVFLTGFTEEAFCNYFDYSWYNNGFVKMIKY